VRGLSPLNKTILPWRL